MHRGSSLSPGVSLCARSPAALQGHALMTRHSGSANPCPLIDFDGGFNDWMAAAFNLPKGQTVEQKFGKPFGEDFLCKMLTILTTAHPVLCVTVFYNAM